MSGELPEPLARIIPALLLERFGDPPVKPSAARRPEILIQRVLDERVGERETTGALSVLLKQRCAHALVEQVEQPRFGDIDRGEQQLEVKVTADDGSCVERRAGIRPKALHPPSDHLTHALRQAELRQSPIMRQRPSCCSAIAPDSVR